uniref:Uncharacterized protein n=3 Tax=Kalanchoe fedtschenkoi TaxID=63787 RepID=A0A7N0UNQ3_KALFE
MGSRVPAQHYNLRSANTFIESSLHDLNTVDVRPGDISGLDRDAVAEGSLDNDDEGNSVDCMHETFRNEMRLHSVGVEEDHHNGFNNNRSSRDVYDILTVDDVSPIESSRARFLQIIVDNFISEHVIEVVDPDAGYIVQPEQDKAKRKSREVHYEGDPRFALPLMYIANMYEALVNDVNIRLAPLSGIREKTIGVALEAAGGLYRMLAKKFPRKGQCIFKRRELATSVETKTRFPELVVQEEKRVRFVVVNGLGIVEKPSSVPIDDAEWFRRLTGRSEVAISARDYKYYSPRHKFRRAANSMSSIPGMPAYPGADGAALGSAHGFRSPQSEQQSPTKHQMHQFPQPSQFQPIHQNHHQSLIQTAPATHYVQNHHCGPSHLPEISQSHPSQTIPQHISMLTSHAVGRLHVMPTTPAKYCDECGAIYLRDTSKFCSECGFKRLGI